VILCDTNILIEVYRKNSNIISDVNNIVLHNAIVISDVTRAEILVGARNKNNLKITI